MKEMTKTYWDDEYVLHFYIMFYILMQIFPQWGILDKYHKVFLELLI